MRHHPIAFRQAPENGVEAIGTRSQNNVAGFKQPVIFFNVNELTSSTVKHRTHGDSERFF